MEGRSSVLKENPTSEMDQLAFFESIIASYSLDAIGRVLFSKSILHGNIPSPFAIEALACFQMIKIGLHVGLTRVEIEGDTSLVIRKLQSKGINRSIIGAHILNIRAICERYQVCVFKHVLRQANEVAHLLAVEGLKRNEETYLIGEVPSYAKEVAGEDLQQVRSTFPVDRNLAG
ncbi:hypothetical protein CXB51_017882 [Gossypium anomalum]|uniref:RNase H type-1 domain-containing protein n=1 Tax=Gossypium anomalum TaxID=47600 RepID=A0A8J5YYI0_9ROSI|nr:hypothetical protein CXB51_017882 [Gossypium anomalum]